MAERLRERRSRLFETDGCRGKTISLNRTSFSDQVEAYNPASFPDTVDLAAGSESLSR